MSDQDPAELVTRLSTVVSMVMNLAALIYNASALNGADRTDLRSTLLWLTDEIEWAHTLAVQGLVWPTNAQARIANLRAEASAWDTQGPPSATLLDAVRGCLSMFQPNAGGP